MSRISLKEGFNTTVNLNYPECRIILKRLAEAMSYFHAKDIAHRDLKLENILYIQEGVIKVIDFGFAVQSKEKQRTFCGTPTYMAPEIVKRVPYKGSEVDIWALGIMVYRMLTGTYPFMAQTDKELYKKIIIGQFDSAKILEDKARDLVCRMLRVKGEERITAAEVQSNHQDREPSMAGHRGVISAVLASSFL